MKRLKNPPTCARCSFPITLSKDRVFDESGRSCHDGCVFGTGPLANRAPKLDPVAPKLEPIRTPRLTKGGLYPPDYL